MKDKIEIELLDGLDYQRRRDQIAAAAAKGALTMDMIEQAMKYGYKSTAKPARTVNLGFECFLRHFGMGITLPFGALYDFLWRAQPYSGVGHNVYDYRMLRSLTKEERCKLICDGVLLRGVVLPQALPSQAHMARLDEEELGEWVLAIVKAYRSEGESLSSEHPLAVIVRYGTGEHFEKRVPGWWRCMSATQARKILQFIADKRPDVFFMRLNPMPATAVEAAVAMLGQGIVSLAQKASLQMPSFTGVSVHQLFRHLTPEEIHGLLKRFRDNLPVRAVCEAVTLSLRRNDDVAGARQFVHYFADAEVAMDFPAAEELYQRSFAIEATYPELAVEVRDGLLAAFTRCGWQVGTTVVYEGKIRVLHEGNCYTPRSKQFSCGENEKVLFKPVNEAQQARSQWHRVSMMRLQRDT